MKFLFVTSAVVFCGAIFGDQLAPTLHEVNLEGGNIFSAAISVDSNIAYFQQLAFSKNPDAPWDRTMKLSAINTKTFEVRASTTLPAVANKIPELPCRDMAAGTGTRRLYTCSDKTFIRILDPDDLHTIGQIQAPAGAAIKSFTVDEENARLYLLTTRDWQDLRLEQISLSTGLLIRSLSLWTSPIRLARVVIDRGRTEIAVSIDPDDDSGSKSDLILCSTARQLHCREPLGLKKIGGLTFAGDRLLIAEGLGDHRGACILSLDPDSESPKKAFCDSKWAVHFSAAQVGKQSLVAFTGLNRQILFSDLEKPLRSAISLWNLESHQQIGTVQLPKDFATWAAAATLVGSDGLHFVAYQAAYHSSIAFIGQLEPAR